MIMSGFLLLFYPFFFVPFTTDFVFLLSYFLFRWIINLQGTGDKGVEGANGELMERYDTKGIFSFL